MRDRAKDLGAPLRWNKKPWVCPNGNVPRPGALGGHGPYSINAIGDTCCECRGKLRRRRVFSLSLGDWLDQDVPIEWLSDMLKTIYDTPNLDWLLLTKRPENLERRLNSVVDSDIDAKSAGVSLAYSWLNGIAPDNCWIGVTVENQAMADKRIPLLLQIPAKVRFLSVEPMLGPINLKPLDLFELENLDCGEIGTSPAIIKPGAKPLVNWVICGGESGSKRRPFNAKWARSLRNQCAAASVPFFMKQMDKVQPIPEDLMVRQFPTA